MPDGHQAIIKTLKKAKVSQVCLEATGAYHIDSAVALHDSGYFEVTVVNPKSAKRFAQATMRRTRTDAVDAVMLAEYAGRMSFAPWQRPSNAVLAIRACLPITLAARQPSATDGACAGGRVPWDLSPADPTSGIHSKKSADWCSAIDPAIR